MNKAEQYAAKITAHLAEMFEGDCEHKIDLSELGEGNNATDFTHALANIAPNLFINRLTGQRKNLLQFNHMANHLCFQYLKSDTEPNE